MLPASRSASVSPTHTIGISPAASAALVRALTVSSVSPKYWRRSLWPMITYSTPRSFSIAAEISPVYAPAASQCTFCAPSFTFDPAQAAAAAFKSVKGGQTTTSTCATSATSFLIPSISAAASDAVLFIFQLPATIFLRIMLSLLCKSDGLIMASGRPICKSGLDTA